MFFGQDALNSILRKFNAEKFAKAVEQGQKQTEEEKKKKKREEKEKERGGQGSNGKKSAEPKKTKRKRTEPKKTARKRTALASLEKAEVQNASRKSVRVAERVVYSDSGSDYVDLDSEC